MKDYRDTLGEIVIKVSSEKAAITEEWLKLKIRAKPYWMPMLLYKRLIRWLVYIEVNTT